MRSRAGSYVSLIAAGVALQGEDKQVPTLVEGADVASKDLGPQEAFLLSCIDGMLGTADLADLAGLAERDVKVAVDRLVELGLVSWGSSGGPDQPAFNRAELNEEVDLNPEMRKRVLETFHGLEELTHYQALDVDEKADRQEIRQAYFQLSKVFHPDTLYGKKLGSYKSKMEAIFRRITDAYDVLGKQKKRDGYDRYLASQEILRDAEQELSRGERKAKALKRAVKQGASLPPVQGPPPSSSKSPKVAATTTEGDSSISAEERRRQRKRDLLLRRLKGASTKLPAHQFVPENIKKAPGSEREDALRKLTASLKQSAEFTGGIDQVQKHLMSAKVAEADDNLAKAASALRMALALAPDRPDISNEYRRVNGALQANMLETHRTQARYEEDSKMWAAAAISWAKVAEGDPKDAVAPKRVAQALWQAGGDLKTARAYVQRSIDLAPDNLETRILLARIYLGAKMENSARKELQGILEKDPDNHLANNLLAKLEGK